MFPRDGSGCSFFGTTTEQYFLEGRRNVCSVFLQDFFALNTFLRALLIVHGNAAVCLKARQLGSSLVFFFCFFFRPLHEELWREDLS